MNKQIQWKIEKEKNPSYTTKDYKMEIPQVFKQAKEIEDILCLATLITSGNFLPAATLEDSENYYNNLGIFGCGDCKLNDICLACIINQ